MKICKRILIILLALILAIALAAAAIGASALVRVSRRTAGLRDDISQVTAQCSQPVALAPLPLVTQQISCGYAVVEMVTGWAGDPVTEQTLYDTYGKVVTSTASGFARELDRQLPGYQVTKEAWLTDSQYLLAVYQSLEAGYPVPIQWAAQLQGDWTLHYSLVTAMDLPGDAITVLNPYGYEEVLTAEEFLSRTRFDAYSPMPLWLKLAFGFDIFEKNTLFRISEF